MDIKFNLILLILFILIMSSSLSCVEGFSNNDNHEMFKRRSNYGGTAGRYGPGMFRHRAPAYPRRHAWRRGPATGIYDGTPYYWGGWRRDVHPNIYNFYPSWLYTGQCRRGCAYIGNGAVGCVNPTNLPDSCIFASDCNGC